MKTQEVNIYFYNFEGLNIIPAKFTSEILKLIRLDKNENFLGFNKITLFKNQMLHQLGNKNIEENKIDEKKNSQIEKCIVNFMSKFGKDLRLKYKPIRFYIYPWFPEPKVSKEFGGVNAITTYFTVIHLYIDYKNFSLKSLEETLAHELNHLYFYQVLDNCILNIQESIIAEGLAEHFREHLVGGKVAPWSKALGDKKVYEYLPKLVKYFNSYDRNIYNSIFYGGGDFQKWTGYSVGYVLVKKFLKNNKKLSWEKIMKTDIKKFFE